MKHRDDFSLGIMFRREYSPETLPDFARRTEAAGFDELWVVEDCFYGSGVASAATALACTDALTVGLGIMPAVVRNPVFSAMEIATLARLYPDRFLPGLGHGVASWMRQIGAFPKSQLAALEEVTVTIKKLLAGEHVTLRGRHVQIEDAELVHPPEQIPPVSLGVAGPKSLALSGRVADGTILAEYSAPAYVSWARDQITGSMPASRADSEHRLTIFAFACAASSAAIARQKLRPMVAAAIASGGADTKLAAMGILAEAREYRKSDERAHLEACIPDAWIDQLAIVGTPQDWRLAIDRYVDLGVHSVVLVPLPDTDPAEVDRFAQHLKS